MEDVTKAEDVDRWDCIGVLRRQSQRIAIDRKPKTGPEKVASDRVGYGTGVFVHRLRIRFERGTEDEGTVPNVDDTLIVRVIEVRCIIRELEITFERNTGVTFAAQFFGARQPDLKSGQRLKCYAQAVIDRASCDTTVI
jgi:hypothetical protein